MLQRAYEAPSIKVTPRETRKPTTSKPPRRPVSCAPSPPIDARTFPPSPSHRTLYSHATPPRAASPDSTPHTVLSSRSSPVLHRDDGSTWRLVERVTEVFIVDVAPAPSRPPPPPPPLHRASSAPKCSTLPPRPLALDDPDRTPRRPPAQVPRTRSLSRSRSSDPTHLSPRLAALADTLRTLDDAERARHRASAAPLVPRSPRTTSMSGAELAHELGLRLEGLGTLYPGGVPRALGPAEEGRDDDDGWWDGQALKSAWSLTTDEGGDEAEGESAYGEAEEGGPCEEDGSRTPSVSSSPSSSVSDDEASRRGSRDSWQSEATTVSAHSAKGAARREAVEREAEQACRRWRAWGAS